MAALPPDAQFHEHGANYIALYVLLTFACLICAWCFWVGLMLARLWHYGGSLHGPFEKFDIQSEHIRERLACQRAEYELAGIPFSILDAHHWQSNVLAHDEEDVEKLPLDVRRRIREEQRISKMPEFIADDCGDETLFPDILPAIPAKEYNALNYGEKPGDRDSMSKDIRALGLRKLGSQEWLAHAVDEREYLEHSEARKRLLASRYDACIQVTPNGEDACVELLEEVVVFLTKEKPQWFQLEETYGMRKSM
jgi:hypothetical protein